MDRWFLRHRQFLRSDRSFCCHRFFCCDRFLCCDRFFCYGQNFRNHLVFHKLHLSLDFLRLVQRVPSGSGIDSKTPRVRALSKTSTTSP